MKKRGNKFRKIFSLTTMFILLFSLVVFAQDMDLTELDLDALMEIEIDTVYSASKHVQKVTEAPSSITIVTSEDIKKYGYRDFGEVLQSIRGFHVTDDRNYKYLGVRGFGLPSDYSNRVLVLVDGRRTNDNIYDAPGIGPIFEINLDLIDRIEVVRGPGSSLYGTSAFFAVVNVITRNGSDVKGFEVAGETGTFNRNKVSLSYGNEYQNGLSLLLSATFQDSDGDDDLDYSDTYNENPWICWDDDPDNCYGLQDNWYYVSEIRAKDLDYDKAHKYFAEFNYKDYTLQSTYYHRKKGIPTAPWDTVFNDSGIFSVDQYFSLDFKYEHTYANNLSVLSRVNYNHYKYYGDYKYDSWEGYPDELIPILNDDSADGKWINGEIHVTKNLWEKHKVTVGGSYNHNIKQDQETTFTGPAGFDLEDAGYIDFKDTHRNDNWSVFVQDEFKIVDRVILNAGVRYDDYDTFGGTTNPRLALIFNPVGDTSIKAIYGQAFRAPNNYELYYGDDVTQKGNPDLEPETIESYEIILEHSISGNVRGTIAGFQNNVKDLITQDLDATDGLLVFNNSEEIQTRGVEFELEGKFRKGISSRASYAYQKTKNEVTDEVLTNSPQHMVKANLSIPVIKEKLFFGIEQQYTSKRRTLYKEKQAALPDSLRNADYPSDQYADAFAVTNITLFGQKIWKTLEASASVYNLFDKKYAHPGAGEHFQDTIEQNGRTFRAKLAYKF
jgi:iron complex outermembrane receptor protein